MNFVYHVEQSNHKSAVSYTVSVSNSCLGSQDLFKPVNREVNHFGEAVVPPACHPEVVESGRKESQRCVADLKHDKMTIHKEGLVELLVLEGFLVNG